MMTQVVSARNSPDTERGEGVQRWATLRSIVTAIVHGVAHGVKAIWSHLSLRIVLYLGVATQSYVVGTWFYREMNGVDRFWDGVFAIIAGIALDLMVVKVATGPQDYNHAIIWIERNPFRVNFNWSKLTPLAAYIGSSLIAYDTYATVRDGAWVDTRALLHIAFPTVVYFASQYEAYMRHVQEAPTPKIDPVDINTIVRDAMSHIEQRVNEQVTQSTARLEQCVIDAMAASADTAGETQTSTSDRVRAYLSEYPNATNKDVADTIGCAPSLVSRIRKEQREA